MSIQRWFLLCLLFLVGSASAGVPLTPQPRQLGVADGLPSGRINAFAEDHLGYLWMASYDGLARYDGRRFRVWRAEDGLRDNLIWSLYVDKSNRLWIGTENAGIAVLDATRSKFTFYDRNNTPELGSNIIWCIAATPDGSLWFGTSGAGLTRRLPNGRFQRFMPVDSDPRSLPNSNVIHMEVTPDGSLWVATERGLARWTGRDFERVPASELPSQTVNRLGVEDDGSLWIATTRGAVLRKPDGQYVKQPWSAASNIPVLQTMLRDRAGTYWLDTASGMGYYNGGKIENVPLYSVSSHGLVKPSWLTGYEDRDGGLWFASLNANVWHLPANWRQFAVLSNEGDDPASMYNPYVLATAPSRKGGLWLAGTRGALDWLDPQTGRVEHHLRVIDSVNWPQSMTEDRLGRIWIGLNGQLKRYDPATHALLGWTEHDAVDPTMPGPIDIATTCGDALWLYVPASGLQVRNFEGRVLQSLALGTAGLAKNMLVREMKCAPDGRVVLATEQGLVAWDAAGKHFEPVPGSPKQAIFSFAFDGHQRVWLGEMGRLESYAWDGHRLKLVNRIGRAEGFPLVSPISMIVDGQGIVWVGSTRGIARVAPVTRDVRLYGVRDGLPSPEIRDRSLVQAVTGQVSAATPDGLVLFDPTLLKPSKRQPALQIESVSVRRGDNDLDLTNVAQPVIQSEDRDLHIVARLLSFSTSRETSYRFRLSGYDPGWVEVGSQGERLFSRLPAGRYTLEIQGRNSDNVWSAVKSFRFRVTPPWWYSPWGLAFWTCLFLLMVCWVVYRYRRRLRRRSRWHLAQHKRAVAEQASRAKTNFLATLGHEVRTPMTGVLGMSELLLSTKLDARQYRYIRAIQNAGTHLVRLLNDALDLARIEAGRLQLELQDFNLRQLLDEVAEFSEPMAERKGLLFSMTVSPDLGTVFHGDPVRIRQILLNLIGNAIKFTGQGSVELHAQPLGAQGVHLVVSDTGPGIAADQLARLFKRFEQGDKARSSGSGLGLAISRELAHEMGGEIQVESQPGHGTRFLIDLPLPIVVQSTLPEVSHAALAPVEALSILLVEDDTTVAAVIVGLLQAAGHRVKAVGHGLAALTEVTLAEFDIVLLDLDLPGIDGLAIAQQLRLQGFSSALLAVTARADSDAESLAIAAGFDGFLRKPVTGQLLAEGIAAACAAAQTRRSAAQAGST